MTTQTYPKDLDGKNLPPLGSSPELRSYGDTLSAAKADGSAMIQHLKDDGAEMAHSAMNSAQHKYADIKSASAGYLSSVEKEVSAKPVQSMAIAFASGALLSLLLNRR